MQAKGHNLSSVYVAENLLCGDTVGHTLRQVEQVVLAIAWGKLVAASAQFLQPGDGLFVNLPIAAIEPIQKPSSMFVIKGVHCSVLFYNGLLLGLSASLSRPSQWRPESPTRHRTR